MALSLVKLMFFTCCIAAISAQAAFYPVWLESLSSEDNGTAITADAMTNRDAMIRAARQLRPLRLLHPPRARGPRARNPS